MARNRDARTYITVHDGMPDHPKVDPLSDAAFRLLVTTWCWCSRHRTDGWVPAATWAKRGTPKTRQELVKAGLAEVTDDGTQMHDYLEHQRSAAEIAELSAARSKSGRRGGKARAERQATANQTAKQVLEPLLSKTQAESVTETEVASTEATTPTPTAAPAPPPRPSRAHPDPGREANAGNVIAAFVEGAREAGMDTPAESLRKRVGKQARELLAEGFAPDRVLAAARVMGRGGWTDLAVQLQRDQAATAGTGRGRGHQTFRNPTDPQTAYGGKL